MDLHEPNSQEHLPIKFKDTINSDRGTQGKRTLQLSQTSSKYESLRKRLNRNIEPDSQESNFNQNWNQFREERLKNGLNLQAIEEQHSVVSSDVPMRKRYGHLLPGYMSANYSLQHRKLFRIQSSLDQVIEFLRDHRQKTKGVFFGILKKNLQNVSLQLQNLRQIMFLAPHLYTCQLKLNKSMKNDICVSLPDIDDLCLNQRNNQFRQLLYKYINQHKSQYQNRPDLVKIPEYIFEFQKKQQDGNKTKAMFIQSIRTGKNIFLKEDKQSKINPFDVIKLGSQHFEKLLIAEIKQKQKRIKQKNQKANSMAYGDQQMLVIIDEISRIYKRRDKSCMFKATLITDLDKNLSYDVQIIDKIVNDIIERFPLFLRKNQHQGGWILQIQKKYLNDIRKEILMKKSSMQKMDDIIQKQGEKIMEKQEQIGDKDENKQLINEKNKLSQLHVHVNKQKQIKQYDGSSKKNMLNNPINPTRVAFSLQPSFKPLASSKYIYKKKKN